MILYGQQDISAEDIEAVNQVLTSSHLTQGQAGRDFEQVLCNLTTARYAKAFSSATGALHASCLALGVGKGDFVWTSPISFVASSNCALYCGASVDFVDIEVSSGNINIEKLTEKLRLAAQQNRLPKVIIPVHLAGHCCDMAAIYALSQQYGFAIIEDASHAIGGRYQEQPIGACQYSDITVFSFHPVKIITTGEGGAALTQSSELNQRLELFRSHGVTADPELMTKTKEGNWYYQQIALGFNYRMTDIQAALGVSQAKRLNEFVRKRNALAARYNNAFSGSSIKPISPSKEAYSSYHLYLVQNKNWTFDKKKHVFDTMRTNGIQVHVHYIPIPSQPYYQSLGFKMADFPHAQQYYNTTLSLPLHPNLNEEQQDYVINTLLSLIGTGE